ncbi:phage antirepressor N-terminal domain-containing protein [Ancylobacter sp. SL191]|uniref:phage antirepressor N-terminal domain-containing protein n=1 Tax=Ancylobacter sp. SL191 TaxID=2995166 RepID=UPI002271D1EB|nr:phage antirepressor N-terminal domain-containing protein [Ancylobacter sp. SL191]WAC26429.1 primase-like DNA-binding domain-containing protein [Ancylobacter sp. SL191]
MNALSTINFHGDTLFAVERGDGVFVAVTPICDRLGIAATKQRERIQRDAVLSEGIAIMALPSAGGVQETFCLRLDLINGWLFGIDESRVKDEETRQRVLAYKRECYRVLFDHFFGGKVSEPEPEPKATELLPGHSDFAESVRLVREARLSRGKDAAVAVWRRLGLPWVPELAGTKRVTIEQAEDDEDAVARFAIEGIEKVRGVVTPAAMLWPAFAAYCARTGLHNPGQQSFATRFGKMGFRKTKTTGRVVYYGIRPADAAAFAQGGTNDQ